MAKKPVAMQPVDVDHPSFRSWFGNSVAHDDGAPRRYFTGTSKDVDFPDFKVSRHGAWFTTDPKDASGYAEQNDSQNYRFEAGKVRQTNTASRVIPAYLKAENPYTGDKPDNIMQSENYKKAQSDWFDTLRAQGYDSWVPESQGGNLAVILGHPGQIKSAVSNTGDFDPDQKRIDRADGGALTDDDGITAYHGSPHDFEQFDTSKIGTGEGAQAYGHGLYFAESEPIAKGYRDALSADSPIPIKIDDERHHPYSSMQRMVAEHFGDVDAVLKKMNPKWEKIAENYKSISPETEDLDRYIFEDEHHEAQKQRAEVESMRGKKVKYGDRGHMYEVHINAHPEHFLDWDRPLSEQSQHVKNAVAAIKKVGKYVPRTEEAPFRPEIENNPRGRQFVSGLVDGMGGRKEASQHLSDFGIKGIKYLDADSREDNETPTHNYVVFNHDHVRVKRKYARGGTV